MWPNTSCGEDVQVDQGVCISLLHKLKVSHKILFTIEYFKDRLLQLHLQYLMALDLEGVGPGPLVSGLMWMTSW